MYERENVIKVRRVDAETIAGPLDEGVNVIKTTAQSMFSSTKMVLQYEIVVPYLQRNGDDYCFISFSSIVVSGRGSKSYSSEISRRLFDSFYEIKAKEENVRYDTENSQRLIMTGYDPLTLAACYMVILFVSFANENGIDLTHDEERRFIPSSKNELNRMYYTFERAGKTKENGSCFILGNGYFQFDGTIENCYDLSFAIDLFRLINTHSTLIIDQNERVWKRTATVAPVKGVQGEINEMYGHYIVNDGKLYKEEPLFAGKGNKHNYVAYNHLIYVEMPNKVHLLNNEKPEPAFETNLGTEQGYAGGVYSSVMLDGVKVMIVPYRFEFSPSTETTRGDVVVIDKAIYGLVGLYDEVGFIEMRYRYNDCLFVGERPNGEHTMFYETFSEVPLSNYEMRDGQQITMKFFDKAFEQRQPRYQIGDSVRVLIEKGPDTHIKGLDGVVVGLSRNKAKVEVSFFGYFQGKFNFDEIEKIETLSDKSIA